MRPSTPRIAEELLVGSLPRGESVGLCLNERGAVRPRTPYMEMDCVRLADSHHVGTNRLLRSWILARLVVRFLAASTHRFCEPNGLVGIQRPARVKCGLVRSRVGWGILLATTLPNRSNGGGAAQRRSTEAQQQRRRNAQKRRRSNGVPLLRRCDNNRSARNKTITVSHFHVVR